MYDSLRVRQGHSLLELAVVVAILGVLLAVSIPAAKRAQDRLAVRSACTALAAAAARARTLALSAGGARLVVEVAADAIRIESRDGTQLVPPVSLAGSYGVDLTVDRSSADRVDLWFDALGIGRLANRTLRVRRGGEEARITLSSYGRVRSW